MNKFINKKIVVITGASRGLGKALADKLGAPNVILVLCSKDIKELQRVDKKLKSKGFECHTFRVDVSKKNETVKFIKATIKKFSKIDVFINNAGAIHKGKQLEKIKDSEFELCIKTNLYPVFYSLREIIPNMKKRKSGLIIAISSTASRKGHSLFAAYAASKSGVNGLMQSAARSLNESGVRCITILPAGINTAMRKYIFGEKDAQKQQSPETVAEIIKNIIENEAQFPNGSEIEIRDGKISQQVLL